MGEMININVDKDTSINEFGINSGNKSIPVYLQLIPGEVKDVVCGKECPAYTNPSDINSILAYKHIGGASGNKIASSNRYYPLYRGMCDTPVKGDSILLLEGLAGQDYYIGPLNSVNSPNYNIDPLSDSGDVSISQGVEREERQTFRDRFSIPKNFSLSNIPRLQKESNVILDDPEDARSGEPGSTAKGQPFGDMIMEGRYGNSIRIGSRYKYPLMIFSNGRNQYKATEGFSDGSLVSITSFGSLRQNFKYNPILGSDDVRNKNPRKLTGGSIASEETNFNYTYGEDDNQKPLLASQIFVGSDRLVFNSSADNITLSSFRGVDIGAGTSLTVNTKNQTVIESSNIYLGKQAFKKHLSQPNSEENTTDTQRAQPLVLGVQLKILLDELIDMIKSLTVQIPSSGVSGPPPEYQKSALDGIKNKLSNMWSEYHFIEDNGQKKKA